MPGKTTVVIVPSYITSNQPLSLLYISINAGPGVWQFCLIVTLRAPGLQLRLTLGHCIWRIHPRTAREEFNEKHVGVNWQSTTPYIIFYELINTNDINHTTNMRSLILPAYSL